MPKGSFSFSWQIALGVRIKHLKLIAKYRILYLNLFCVQRMSTVTILGKCSVWFMSGSGKDNSWKLTIPPCVFVCVSVLFLHFFIKSALDRANTVLYLTCPGCVLLKNKKVDLISSPYTTLPHLSCLLLTASIMMCSEETDCSSS